jgi:hypothetical protein
MVFVGEVGGGDVLVAGQTLVLTAIVRADEVLLCVGGGGAPASASGSSRSCAKGGSTRGGDDRHERRGCVM